MRTSWIGLKQDSKLHLGRCILNNPYTLYHKRKPQNTYGVPQSYEPEVTRGLRTVHYLALSSLMLKVSSWWYIFPCRLWWFGVHTCSIDLPNPLFLQHTHKKRLVRRQTGPLAVIEQIILKAVRENEWRFQAPRLLGCKVCSFCSSLHAHVKPTRNSFKFWFRVAGLGFIGSKIGVSKILELWLNESFTVNIALDSSHSDCLECVLLWTAARNKQATGKLTTFFAIRGKWNLNHQTLNATWTLTVSSQL